MECVVSGPRFGLPWCDTHKQTETACWKDERDRLRLQNGELLALMKKIDAFFEDPRILVGSHTVVLDVPYEIAVGVKAALTDTTLKQ
jgi:hypothetical protein